MSGNNKNEGVRLIADFKDQAIPLSKAQAGPEKQAPGTRSANTGICLVADFRDQAQPLTGSKPTSDELLDEAEESDPAVFEADLSPSAWLESVTANEFVPKLRATPEKFSPILEKVIFPFVQQQARLVTRRITGRVDENFADELGSDVITGVWYKVLQPTDNPPRPLVFWLADLVWSHGLKLHKERIRTAERMKTVGVDMDVPISSSPGEIEVDYRDWQFAFFQRLERVAASNFSPSEIQIFACWVEGNTITEIAKRFGFTKENAYARIHRLRQRIKAYFEAREEPLEE